MKSSVAKTATDREIANTPAYFYDSARAGMRDLLVSGKEPKARQDGVLLPGYIGWSAREGSGVFDPVRQSERPYGFYRLTQDLLPNLDDLAHHLRSGRYQYVVVIHYFGRSIACLAAIRQLADETGTVVIQDLAHGFFSAASDPAMLEHSHVAMYSLHKQFPFADGGMVVYRDTELVVGQTSPRADLAPLLLSYDWPAIAALRRANFEAVLEGLQNLPNMRRGVRLMWPTLGPTEVPQTLPVEILASDRDRIYAEMNAEGFGMVSLYHTLIEEQRKADAVIDRVSKQIINFPVHQDMDPSHVPAMLDSFARALSHHSEGEKR